MRRIDALLNEYGESHQNPTNKAVHWICVPLIFWSIVALLFSIPISSENWWMNAALFALVLVMFYYFRLSTVLAIGMALFASVCLVVCYGMRQEGWPVGWIALGVFVAAWIGQFWGHKVEGKKPSFLKDIQFLLIGPAWLMSFLLKGKY